MRPTMRFFVVFVSLSLLLSANLIEAQDDSCQKVSGHIQGRLGLSTADCPFGTETGSFTGLGDGAFFACIKGFEQKANGSLRFELEHVYTTSSGDTSTTTDRVVASPVDRAAGEYLINNRVDITGGTGHLKNAFGFLRTHGTVNLMSQLVSVDYHGNLCVSESDN